jgi:hypothetical protein
MNARRVLLATGLAYTVWETVDIFWIDFPAAAAVMATLFLAATVWFWRRNSARAAAALLVLCAFEAAVVPTLHVEPVTRAFDAALGVIGVASALCVLVVKQRRRHAPPAPGLPPAARPGSALLRRRAARS